MDQKSNKEKLNSTIQPISQQVYSQNGKYMDKSPQSAMNTRNWRNKSIDTTPEIPDHYSYPVSKRAGSTAAGDRQHQTLIVGQNKMGHMSQNAGTTDYNYHIGPANQFKQTVAPKNATKFSDLKFHHTALDFNKNSQQNPNHT